jgi:hypothetical protein
MKRFAIKNSNQTIYGREFVLVKRYGKPGLLLDESKIYKFNESEKSSYEDRPFDEEFYDE